MHAAMFLAQASWNPKGCVASGFGSTRSWLAVLVRRHLTMLLLCQCLAGPALAFELPETSRYKLDFGTELRYFPESPRDPRQTDATLSFSLLGRADYEWNGGRTRLTITPFVRYDSADGERTHADLREFELRHRSGNFDWRAGIGKVFWGTTEFVHLVDIVNQTDAVESIDGEDKLGQPMLSLSWSSYVGVFSGYLLPVFRERRLPGIEDRLRGSVPYRQGAAEYESSQGKKHVDAALRWQYSDGTIDIGVAHFTGTAREPRFRERNGSDGLFLQAIYDQIRQTSLDFNLVSGNWIWKLEALRQRNRIRNYSAVTGGFEYTFISNAIEAPEIGLLLEYAWDSRGTQSPSAFQDDLFIGLRVGLNDVAGSELLTGVGRDLEHGSHFVSVDASRRIGGVGRLALKLRMIDGDKTADPISALTREDHLILEYTHYY